MASSRLALEATRDRGEDGTGRPELAKLRAFLFREFPELKLINEIANGSKHVEFEERKGRSSKVTKTERGHVYGTGLLLPRDKPCLFVYTDNMVYMADDLCKWALDYWDDLFKRLGL